VRRDYHSVCDLTYQWRALGMMPLGLTLWLVGMMLMIGGMAVVGLWPIIVAKFNGRK
jgi:hypothetical protein